MANQLAIAYSSYIKGAGVLSAGPYYCSEGIFKNIQKICENASKIDVVKLTTAISYFLQQNQIDNPANLTDSKFYLFGGKNDEQLPVESMYKTRDLLRVFTLKV